MMHKLMKLALLLLLAASLAACNLARETQPTANPQFERTAAAITVAAQLTQAASGGGSLFPTNTPPAPVQPSATLMPTQPVVLPTLNPTNTQAPPQPTNTLQPPTATTAVTPCDRASFVKDVTYPDDSEVSVGTTFIKTWRLKNTGSCTWNSSYSLVFVEGDSMGAPAAVQLTTGTVAPGESVDVSVTLVAPTTVKTYQGKFQLRNSAGIVFGIGQDAKSSFWVKVKVTAPATPTATLTATPAAALQFDFVARGSEAEWRNSTSVLPWGDPVEDKFGVAVNADNEKLEDGRFYNRMLATLPEQIDNGSIRGRYPAYAIQNGDHFRVTIGLQTGCKSGGKVRFQVKYEEGGVETLLGEWIKTCDGTMMYLDKDLSSLAGKTVNFSLSVVREGAPMMEFAYWLAPRIER